MSRDSATLLDMLKAARLAVEFREGMEKRAFLNDPKTQSAILHQLLILGEAAKRLSQEFRTQHQKIPWKQIAGMRDKLIHEYDKVDLEEVWKTAKSDMPRLIKQLEPLAPTKEEDE
ncbi:MAG TPA: DUF86 domain-containing protein [Candidatus Binatia bacterium]|nr:DUF86 domain-containing protein [Candidatus Binatia bacterium]